MDVRGRRIEVELYDDRLDFERTKANEFTKQVHPCIHPGAALILVILNIVVVYQYEFVLVVET